MSYILDALRKLEQSRQHEESLTFLAFQGPAPRKRKRRLWPYLLLAALMVNAGAILWWIGPWQSPGKSIPAGPPEVRGVKPALPASGPSAAALQGRAGGEKTSAATREVKERPRPAGQEMIAVPQLPRPSSRQPSAPQQAPVADEASLSPLATPAPPVQPEAAPPANGRVMKRADLPATVAAGLPEFKISLHYYIAEPRSRVVLINDRTLREGDSLSDGLKVEQINEGGVVMNYRGWRFQLDVNGNP